MKKIHLIWIIIAFLSVSSCNDKDTDGDAEPPKFSSQTSFEYDKKNNVHIVNIPKFGGEYVFICPNRTLVLGEIKRQIGEQIVSRDYAKDNKFDNEYVSAQILDSVFTIKICPNIENSNVQYQIWIDNLNTYTRFFFNQD